ncbi:cytochrome c oxidase subunit II [Halomontanus rarus]|uniref:cytochrome c oxidase subunit II n=1 Tax=Halomontanus rarus TaxID=3034020 RepID=UPI0023E78323|nr:cytochrome c oxidase subunit II [Halovivax sp. TS33]
MRTAVRVRSRVRSRCARALATLCWALCALSAVAANPAAAQTAQSVNRDLIQRLNAQYIYVALPLTLFVMVILVYAVVRFRDNDEPRPTVEDAPLEITWTVATGLILLFVGVSAYSVLANPYVSPQMQADGSLAEEGNDVDRIPDDAVVVEVVAYQWEWQFSHPDANVTTRNELVIPADRDVYLVMSSRDVVHSFTVPELGVKQDVFPESQTVIRTHAYETGEYEAMCIEFCGARHAEMRANVTVVDGETYEEWLAANEGEGSDAATDGVSAVTTGDVDVATGDERGSIDTRSTPDPVSARGGVPTDGI